MTEKDAERTTMRQEPGFKTWRVTVEITVADSWVADGFDIPDTDALRDELEGWIVRRLPYAYSGETAIKALKVIGPDAKAVRLLQGYTN